MSERQSDDIASAIGDVIGAAVFLPLLAVSILIVVYLLIAPFLPIALVACLIAAGVYAVHRYRTSPLKIRKEHEREVLALLDRADECRRSLPPAIAVEDMRVAFQAQGLVAEHPLLSASTVTADTIYREDFLRALPPMPQVPLEAEKVYDPNVDRRTLKKGEEPPYRLRTDSRGRPTSLELEEFKEFLNRYIASTLEPSRAAQSVAAVIARVVVIVSPPALAAGSDGAVEVALIDLIPNPRTAIGNVVAAVWHAGKDGVHFSSLRTALQRNYHLASRTHLKERDIAEGKLLNPDDFPGTGRETLEAYLVGTPLYPLLLQPLPFVLPTLQRFEGHWIVARPGSGKTNALECLIHADLKEVSAGRASVLVMDSQGTAPDTLIGRLSRLKVFGPGQALDGKLIYLEPDLDYPLALNIFDIGAQALGRLTASQREDIVSSACDVVEFLFTGLLGGELSDNMTLLYKYLVPAMLAIPNADMNTFIELLDTDTGRDRAPPAGFAAHARHFARIDPDIRSFLENDFLRDPDLTKTKAAVRRRLRASMADVTFRRMFLQPRNKLNLFHELQSAKCIVVNTYPARNYVEQFGRLVLALVMQATHQRLQIDKSARMNTFIYLDECQDYIAREDRIARYIDKCRKQHVGLIFANQRLANIESQRVLNALGNVAIKFAGVSDADSVELASFVGSTAAHIRTLNRGTFASYISGITPQSVDLTFPRSPLETMARLTSHEWDAMRMEMRAKYATRYEARLDAPPTATVTSEEKKFAEQPPVATPRLGDGVEKRSEDDYDPLS